MFGCGDRKYICDPTPDHPTAPVSADPDIAGKGVYHFSCDSYKPAIRLGLRANRVMHLLRYL